MKGMLLYLWQIPQHIAARAVILWTGAKRSDVYSDTGYVARRFCGRWTAVSLGMYRIFASEKIYGNETTRRHEEGHSRQSAILGPIYMLAIGIPSFVGNLLHRVWKFDYYRQPWERWADVLGGVKRA